MSSKKHSGPSGTARATRTTNHNRDRKHAGSVGVRPVRSLGQNFLTDDGVRQAIIDGSGVTEGSLVIEIGPGTGALTVPLAERAGRLIAIEIDERMLEGLRIKTFSYGNTEIIHGDILRTDLAGLIRKEREERDFTDVRIVGNLPYYITTPIIMKLLREDTGASSITVMMQKEVGDRIAAEPGTRLSGAITYPVHYFAEVSKIADAGRECFYPVPAVDSVVLRLDLRDEKPVSPADEDLFFRCIRAGFSQRRKTLLNSLMSLGDIDRGTLAAAMDRAGIEQTRRAETLDLEEFAALSDALSEAGYSAGA